MNKLIPNATSPKNIGDEAILFGLMNVLGNRTGLKIHSTERQLYKSIYNEILSPTLYAWAVFENRNTFVRIRRVLELLYSYFSFKYLKHTFFISKELNSLIKDYTNADLIVFVGGGYLRSQKGLTQSLNLLMILLLFQFAKLTNARKIIAPISFGPFAYKWQEKYSARIIKDFNLVMAREQYSYELLKKYNINNLILSADTSLLLNLDKKTKKVDNKKCVLGFTIRKWLKGDLQEKFEQELTKSIISFSKATGAIVQPIIQVDAPEYGDFDASLTREIASNLEEGGINVSPTKKIKDLNDSIKIYAKIDLLLGMRMHSNILAALQNTPFVAISYEYKTEGIARDLGVEEYCIKIENIKEKVLFELLMKAYVNRAEIKRTLNNSLERVREVEIERWNHILM